MPDKRTTWPAGHVISMTREYPDDGAQSVATCECGWQNIVPVARTSYHVTQDIACESHWRSVEEAANAS